MKKVYLGEGVYVQMEDGMLKLTTENGMDVTNTIYLESPVWINLVGYVERLKTLWETNEK